VLTIHQSSTFMVTDLGGEIGGEGELGVFADDTRFVSHYAISANGERWTPLTASATAHNAATVHLTNPTLATEDGAVAQGTLGLTITRIVDEGIHEDLDLTNYSLNPVRFHLEIALRSDFADLFEVKEHKFVRRGHIHTEWNEERSELLTSYTNRDFHRRFTFHAFKSDVRPHYANGRVTFPVELAPGASWHTCCEYVLGHDDQMRAPAHEHPRGDDDEVQLRWLSAATALSCANEDVYRLYRQSVEDMGGMRLRDYDLAPDVWLPAAGVPWFVTIFGRDSLIVSLQTMMVHTCLALGALKNLARLQASARDDWRDAEPGKIPHEIRFGELAHFKRIPHTPYYGTADATPLFLIALHESWKWLGDTSLLREYRDALPGVDRP
jgi:glycogen debranching enzyme